MSRSVWTKRSSIVLISLEKKPMLFHPLEGFGCLDEESTSSALETRGARAGSDWHGAGRSTWQPYPGRRSAYRRENSVQTNRDHLCRPRLRDDKAMHDVTLPALAHWPCSKRLGCVPRLG